MGEPFQTFQPEPDGIAMPTFFEGYVVSYHRTPSRVGNMVSSQKERGAYSDNRKGIYPEKWAMLLSMLLLLSISKI